MRITLPCLCSAAINNNSSVMTVQLLFFETNSPVQFLFLHASNNQQVGLIQAASAAAAKQFQIQCQSSTEGKQWPLKSMQ